MDIKISDIDKVNMLEDWRVKGGPQNIKLLNKYWLYQRPETDE